MSNLFSNLFSPAKIGNLELKKRVCKAPQSSGMNNMDGTVSERGISSIDVSHHGLRLHHAAGIRRGHHPKRQGRLCSAGPPL